MLRCKYCGEEIGRVEATWDGYETQVNLKTHGTLYISEYGGDVEESSNDVDHVDYDMAEVNDCDYTESLEAVECPECGHSEASLYDLVEVYDPDEEEEEEDEEVHGPYELVGAMREQHYGWFDTLTEAIDKAESCSTFLFVRREGKAVWVNTVNGSDQGQNYLSHPKGGELAEDGQQLDEDIFAEYGFEVVGGATGEVPSRHPSLEEAIHAITSTDKRTAYYFVRRRGETAPLWATEACKTTPRARVYKRALASSADVLADEVEADDDLAWVAGLE